jgi:hypothetical protein
MKYEIKPLNDRELQELFTFISEKKLSLKVIKSWSLEYRNKVINYIRAVHYSASKDECRNLELSYCL